MADQYKRQIQLKQPKFSGAKDIAQLTQMIEGYLSTVTSQLMKEFTNVERSRSSESTTVVSLSGGSSSGSSGGSSEITDYFRVGGGPVSASGTVFTFSSSLGITPSFLLIRCYDSNGMTVGCDISSISATGFTATPMEDATLQYFASKAI